jgi:hypothetical protein
MVMQMRLCSLRIVCSLLFILLLLVGSAFAQNTVPTVVKTLTVAPVAVSVNTTAVTAKQTVTAVQVAPQVLATSAERMSGLSDDADFKEAPSIAPVAVKQSVADNAVGIALPVVSGSGGGAVPAEKDEYYDSQGFLIARTDKVADISSPGGSKLITHLFYYNDSGDVEKEVVVDRARGLVSDVDGARMILSDQNDLGSLYETMMDMVEQTEVQQKAVLDELHDLSEKKQAAAQATVEQKKDDIDGKVAAAEAQFAPSVGSKFKSFFGFSKKIVREHRDSEGKKLGYTELNWNGTLTSVFLMYDARGKVEQEMTLDHETGALSDWDALTEMADSTDIDQLVEMVMFDAWQSEDAALRETLDKMSKMNEEKKVQRELGIYMSGSKKQADGETRDEYTGFLDNLKSFFFGRHAVQNVVVEENSTD